MRARRPPPPPDPERLLREAVSAWRGDPDRFAGCLAALERQLPGSLTAAQTQLDAAIGRTWQQGWTPAEVTHVLTRWLTADHADATAARIVVDGRRHTAQGRTLHPRWHAQLADLKERARTASERPATDRLRLVVEALGLLARLPRLPRTIPAPGEAAAAAGDGRGHVDERLLTRVRALLAKAESTDFEEEAEAFTAKAQELIARHAIDDALLHADHDVGEPRVRRLLVDDPYASAKASLIAEVAGANRCRVVHSRDLGFVTLFGYEGDLDAVELLATSLLAQATAAMVRQGPRRDAAGRSRTRSFRHAFLLGFGHRIGERLRQATDGQMPQAGDDRDRLLPVLAARDDRLRAAEQEAFPHLVERRSTIGNATGWVAGRAAADQASLNVPGSAVRAGSASGS